MDLRRPAIRIRAVRARPIVTTAILAGIATGAWAALVAPGAAEPALRPARDETRTAIRGGLSVRIPPGWQLTRRQVLDVVSPVQRLVVTSFALPRRAPVGGCDPMQAVRHMPHNGAYLFMWEYTGATGLRRRDRLRLPPRPPRFKLSFVPYAPGSGVMLAGTTFREHGRVFQVQLYLGAHATRRRRAQLLALLDSLAVGA
jgi:hypothetical protein